MAIRDNLITIPKNYNWNDYEPILAVRGNLTNRFVIDVSDITTLYYVQEEQGSTNSKIECYSTYDWDDVQGRVLEKTETIMSATNYSWVESIDVSNIIVIVVAEGTDWGTTMFATNDGTFPKKIEITQTNGYAEMCYKLPYSDNNILKFTSINQTAPPVLDQRNTVLVKKGYGDVVGNGIGTLDAVGSTITTPTDYKLGKWIWIGGNSYGANGAYNAIMEVL